MVLKYELRRDAHAIGEFTASLVFANHVSARAFAKVVELLNEASKALDLPAVMPVQIFNIPIGVPREAPPPPGLGYQRFASNGEVACSLFCDAREIHLTMRDYDRWQSVLPRIVDAFRRVAPGYMVEVPAIRAFRVQYLNEFRSKNSNITSTAELFRPNSRWIAPFSYESNEPWHSHIGQFVPHDEKLRYLVNINCDVSPIAFPPGNHPRVVARATIVITSHYDRARGPLIVQNNELEPVLEQNFNALHSIEKRLLGELIADEYLDVMGEGAREH